MALLDHTSGNAVDILKEADAACYAAKDKGRNRVHVYEATDSALLEQQGQMQWVNRLQAALEAALAVWMLHRLNFRIALQDNRDIVLLLFAATVSPLPVAHP